MVPSTPPAFNCWQFLKNMSACLWSYGKGAGEGSLGEPLGDPVGLLSSSTDNIIFSPPGVPSR